MHKTLRSHHFTQLESIAEGLSLPHENVWYQGSPHTRD